MQITTKFSVGQDVFLIQENKIVKTTISEIKTDETGTSDVVENVTSLGSFSDTDIFASPQECADALVAAYNASIAPAAAATPAAPATDPNASGSAAPETGTPAGEGSAPASGEAAAQ